MSSRTDKEFLGDIQEAIQRIQVYTAGVSYDAFLADTKTQDAVIRNLEIIGEATKGLSDQIRERYTAVPWKNMAGARDRLIHHYFGVNLDVIWGIVTLELSDIAAQLTQILKDDLSQGVDKENDHSNDS